MADKKRTAIAFEGGSLRGMFSAGVADVLMENEIKADGVFGVSAGSMIGLNYVTWQIGRSKRVNVDFAEDSNYYGAKTFIKHRSVFNFDYLFGEISDIYLPLDQDALLSSDIDFTAVATNCITGKPVYFNKHTCSDIMQAIKASSSMPLISPILDVDDIPCLDGGISLPIPYQKPIDEGYEKILVVPTREHGFRKPPTSTSFTNATVNKYREYPNLVKAIIDTPRVYANQANELDRLDYEGRVLMLRPEEPITISRTEKDPVKLIELYNAGRDVCNKNLERIKEYFA